MSSHKQKPMRRRGTVLEKALLDAAWAELNEVGYDQFSFDNVAKRAGTSKTVLYRRWANRLELVHATVREHQPLVSGRIPNTGSLRSDIVALLEQMASGLDDMRIAISIGMLTDVLGDAQQRAYIQDAIHGSNVEAMKEIIGRARARGERVGGQLPDRIMTLPLDLVRNELVITGKPPVKLAINQIVDDIFLPLVSGKKVGSAPEPPEIKKSQG